MLSKSQINLIKSLQEKKGRIENQLFLIEGEKMVSELVQSNFIIQAIYINKASSVSSYQNYSNWLKNIEIIELSGEEMKKISAHPAAPSIIALAALPIYPLELLKYPILVLDEIQDPGNLGTLIRIADWFNFKSILCSPNTVSWHNPKVIQSSMGSFLRIPVFSENLIDFFSRSEKTIYGASLQGASIYETNLSKVEILVLGNESRGISVEIQPYIKQLIKIPSQGMAESLNVSVAGGIILAEIQRQKSFLISNKS